MPNTTGSRVSQVRANDPGVVILDYGPTRNGKTTRYGGGGGHRASAFGAGRVHVRF